MSLSSLLAKALAGRDWLLADGATGTELFNRGLGAGEAAEAWNLSNPAEVRAVMRGAIQAGADLVLTNSYGGNGALLGRVGLGQQVADLNRAAAELAREEADRAGRMVLVAGSVGPTGEILAPMGPVAPAQASALFLEQIEALKAGGADLIWIETMADLVELRAAFEACAQAEMPWCGTMNFDTAGRTMMGDTPARFAKATMRLPHAPLAIGANCGLGLGPLLASVLELAEAESGLPLIAKGNAGVPMMTDGHIHYDATPEAMADYACLARDIGAAIIGGCCGTTPEHLSAMRKALEERPRGARPARAEIARRMPESAPHRHHH